MLIVIFSRTLCSFKLIYPYHTTSTAINHATSTIKSSKLGSHQCPEHGQQHDDQAGWAGKASAVAPVSVAHLPVVPAHAPHFLLVADRLIETASLVEPILANLIQLSKTVFCPRAVDGNNWARRCSSIVDNTGQVDRGRRVPAPKAYGGSDQTQQNCTEQT